MPDPRQSSDDLVAVIDDDESVREALRGLFQSVGLATEGYAKVQAFLDAGGLDRAGCIVLDIRLPGQSGLEFQETLAKSDIAQSVVLISAHVDVSMAVRAMKASAVDVLTKPESAARRNIASYSFELDSLSEMPWMPALLRTAHSDRRSVSAMRFSGTPS